MRSQQRSQCVLPALPPHYDAPHPLPHPPPCAQRQTPFPCLWTPVARCCREPLSCASPKGRAPRHAGSLMDLDPTDSLLDPAPAEYLFDLDPVGHTDLDELLPRHLGSAACR